MAFKRNRAVRNASRGCWQAKVARQNVDMPTDLAELSSIAASLEQITRRISVMAEQANDEQEETVSSELFSVERALQGASRRLERVVASR
jgi:hypothetical protein